MSMKRVLVSCLVTFFIYSMENPPNEFWGKYTQLLQHIEAQVDKIVETLKSRQASESPYLNIVVGFSDIVGFYARKNVEQKVSIPYSEQLLKEFVAVSERIKNGQLISQSFNNFLKLRKQDKKEEALRRKIANAELIILNRDSLHVSSQINYLHEYEERLIRLNSCLDNLDDIENVVS